MSNAQKRKQKADDELERLYVLHTVEVSAQAFAGLFEVRQPLKQ